MGGGETAKRGRTAVLGASASQHVHAHTLATATGCPGEPPVTTQPVCTFADLQGPGNGGAIFHVVHGGVHAVGTTQVPSQEPMQRLGKLPRNPCSQAESDAAAGLPKGQLCKEVTVDAIASSVVSAAWRLSEARERGQVKSVVRLQARVGCPAAHLAPSNVRCALRLTKRTEPMPSWWTRWERAPWA